MGRVILRALRRQPDDEWLQRLGREIAYAREQDRALALFDAGQTENGMAAMQALVDRFPEEAELELWLASMTVTVGRVEVAAAHAQRAVVLRPSDPIVLFRAASTIRWSDTDRARALLEESKRLIATSAAERDAFRPDFHHLEGLIEHDDGNLADAVWHLEQAFRTDPSGMGHGADLAVAYLEQDRHRPALDVIARALEHHPSNQRLLDLQRQAQDAAELD